MTKKIVSIPELRAEAEFDEEFFNPVKKIGAGSYRSVIENCYNAVVEIGKWSSIGGPLYVHGTTEHPCVMNKEYVSSYPFGDKMPVQFPKTYSKGKIVIGHDVWIGSYVTILSGVTIGNGAIIGAHSVVAKHIPPYAVVVGNPARIIRFRFSKSVCEKLEQIKWWNWKETIIKKRIEDFKSITTFIQQYGK